MGEAPAASTASSQWRKRVHFFAGSTQSASRPPYTAVAMPPSLRPVTGAGVVASPMISVVTPWVILERQRPSAISG